MRLALVGSISFGFIGGAFPQCDSTVQAVLVDGMELAALAVIEGFEADPAMELAGIAVVESLFQSVRPPPCREDCVDELGL
jgi:hypothetical protein